MERSALQTSPLRSALFGGRSHSLRAIIARHLHLNRIKGIFHGSIYATRLTRHFNIPISQSEDPLLPKKYLDYECMIGNYFINRGDPPY